MTTHTCPGCGQPMPARNSHGDPRRYCSATCAVRTAARRNADARAAIVEDVGWLLDAGEAPTAILTRLDTTAEALSRRLHRTGRHDLAAHFTHLRNRTHPCADCGTSISHSAERCRSCAMTNRYRKAA